MIGLGLGGHFQKALDESGIYQRWPHSYPHLRISAQVFLKRRKKRNRKTKKQNSQNWEFFLSLVFRSKVNSSLSIKSWYQVVNGKIRLLCKVENPSVPFFKSFKFNNIGIQSNFQEDDAFQGFQSLVIACTEDKTKETIPQTM